MQRQLYPALLMITIALAAAVHMRPTVGEELIGLAGAWTGRQGTRRETSNPPAQSSVLGPGGAKPSTTQVAAAGSVPWPGTQMHRAFTSSSPPSVSSPAPAYPPLSRRGYAYRPEVGQIEPDRAQPPNPPTVQQRVAPAAGPSYPIVGESQELGAHRPSGQMPAPRYPMAGGGGDMGRPQPPQRYPVAGSASREAYQNRPPIPPESSPPQYGMPMQPPSSSPNQFAPVRQPAPQFQTPPRYTSPSRPEEKVYYPDPSARHSVQPPPSPLGAPGLPHGAQFIPPEAQFAAGPPVIAEVKPCVGAQILAVVGNDVILSSEVTPDLERWLAQVPQSELAKLSKRQLEVQKKALVAKLLQGHIETKLIHQDALRTIPPEGLANIQERIGEHFDKKELPKRMEKAGVTSRHELDEKLQTVGTSVERTKRAFVNRTLAGTWLRQSNDVDSEVSHDQMLDYYREHLAEFETPARVRWETLTVRIPRYTDGSQARAKLAYLGDRAMRGVPIADALKAQPPGTPECKGGNKGWATKGEGGVSPTIEQALFGLPVGRLSQILQDNEGFHIVRVLEREPARRTPFEEAQVEIREKIQELDREEQIQAYLNRLKTQIPVWTIFDDDPDLAEARRQSEAS